jgi:hypothetical protein
VVLILLHFLVDRFINLFRRLTLLAFLGATTSRASRTDFTGCRRRCWIIRFVLLLGRSSCLLRRLSFRLDLTFARGITLLELDSDEGLPASFGLTAASSSCLSSMGSSG